MKLATTQAMAVSSTQEVRFNQRDQEAALLSREPSYEAVKWPYIVFAPLMWVLAMWVAVKKVTWRLAGGTLTTNTFWFDGLGESCRAIKENAMNWNALDIIYNHQFRYKHGIRGKVDDFWIGMLNAQAVRNRLKMLKHELSLAISSYEHKDTEIKVLSLGSGAAQGIIEVIASLKDRGIVLKALLLDMDQSALDYAKELAYRNGIEDQVSTVNARLSDTVAIAQQFKPDIIEMIGLLDYLPHKKAAGMLQRICDVLPSGGTFIVCNIRHNVEQWFLKWVINWGMIYRNPAALKAIVEDGGFKNYRLMYEPLRIHGMVVATKD